MVGLIATMTFLAEAAADGGGQPFSIWPVLAIIFVLFYVMVILPQRKKDKAFRSLVKNLKKNDRVVTIGGIHGVITNVQKDTDRVTVRIDETTGTTIRVNSSAISRVVTDDDKASGDVGKRK